MISSIGFKRHQENPLDTLEIGRVQERRTKAFNELVVKTISDLNTLSREYDVKFIDWTNICSFASPINDPLYGFRIQLKISTFSETWDFFLEYVMETQITRLIWSLNKKQQMNKFGDMEECLSIYKSWLSQNCYKKKQN